MKNTHSSLAIALTLLTPLAAQAAGPFSVLRATSPRDVATAVPAAVVAVSPFEDNPSFLLDGSHYFYAVRDASGNSMRISVIANAALGGVRVSFDDGNPASAPVGAALSTVDVAPATIPADNVSLSTATIVPRDPNGVVLGTGLSIAVEGAALWPGVLRGAIQDRGNGTYVATVASSIPGAGLLRVRVEGVNLTTQPSLSYLNVGVVGDLRESARTLLAGLAASDGPFADPQRSSGPAAASFASARSRLQRAATALSPGDPTRDKQDVMRELDAAIGDLLSAATTDPAALFLLDHVLAAGRLVAVYHVAIAQTLCGTCDGVKPKKACAALASLAEGDALRAVDPARAINAYTRAVDAGVQSRTTCS